MRATRRIKYLTTEEIEALFSVIRDVRDRAIFRLAYHRGLRASEVGRLQLGNYRASSGRLYVERLKGSEAGEYRLTRIEEISLRAWIRERGAAPGPLFPSRERGAIGRRRLDQLMKRYCALAGVPRDKAHFHALKHSCGTHLIEMGQDLLLVKDHLGHRQIQNTVIYTSVTNKARDAAAEKLMDWGKKRAA